MTPADTAFLTAIATIKSLSKGPNALQKPSPERKVQLYGLYKQSTEGNVEGIMPRPEGNDPQSVANQHKWDSWKSREGLSKQEAKIMYVEYLLDTMRASATDHGTPPWLELEAALARAKDAEKQKPAQQHRRRLSMNSVNSGYNHFLRNPIAGGRSTAAFSEFGLSEKDRSELQADRIVDQLQSAYPPVIPGAIYPSVDLPVLSSQYPSLSGVPQAIPVPSGGAGNGGSIGWLSALFATISGWTSRTLESLLKMFITDAAKVVVILLIIRIVASRPDVLRRVPILRRTAHTFGKMLVVVFNGFDIELKMKTPLRR